MILKNQFKHARFLRVTAFLTCVCYGLTLGIFDSTSPAYAQPQTADLKTPRFSPIPVEIARIEKTFRGTSEKTVYLIQDLHASAEAQISIQKLTQFLIGHYGVSIVALEGAQGDLDPALLTAYPDTEKLKQVLKESIEAGETSGAAALSAFPENKTRFTGIEDWDLYEDGLEAFLKSFGEEKNWRPALQKLQAKLQDLQIKNYSHQALNFISKEQSWREDPSKFAEFLSELTKLKPTLVNKYPALKKTAALLNFEKSADHNGIEQEVRRLIAFLQKQGNDQSLLNQWNQSFETQKISALEMAVHLLELEPSLKISKKMKEWIRIHQALHQTVPAQLINELEALIKEAKSSFLVTPKQKEIDAFAQQVQWLENLSKFQLTREGWEEMKGGMEEWESGREKFGFQRDFYEIAVKREHAMLHHLKKLARYENVALVAGGFHSSGIQKELEHAGISYQVLTPVVTTIPDPQFYLDQMQGKFSWNAYLKTDAKRADLYGGFMRAMRDRLLNADPYLAKSWRDNLIRKLANEKRIEQHVQHTKFLDEVLTPAAQNSTLQKLQEKWKLRFSAFSSGLRRLEREGKIDTPRFAQLFQSPAFIPYIQAGVFVPRTTLSSALLNGAKLRSEARPEEIQVDKPLQIQTGVSKVSLVLEGGGPRGLPYLGAWKALAKAGIEMDEVAGNSVGAIIGAMMKIGYGPDEAIQAFLDQDYEEFRDPVYHLGFPLSDIASLTGSGIRYLRTHGLYKGDGLENWIKKLIDAKAKPGEGSLKFKDVPGLTVFAYDQKKRKILKFSQQETPNLEVYKGVTMSARLPYIYPPYPYEGGEVVDGVFKVNLPAEDLIRKQEQGSLKTPIVAFTNQGETEDVVLDLSESPFFYVLLYYAGIPLITYAPPFKKITRVRKKQIRWQRHKIIKFHGTKFSLVDFSSNVGILQFGLTAKKKIELIQSGEKTGEAFAVHYLASQRSESRDKSLEEDVRELSNEALLEISKRLRTPGATIPQTISDWQWILYLAAVGVVFAFAMNFISRVIPWQPALTLSLFITGFISFFMILEKKSSDEVGAARVLGEVTKERDARGLKYDLEESLSPANRSENRLGDWFKRWNETHRQKRIAKVFWDVEVILNSLNMYRNAYSIEVIEDDLEFLSEAAAFLTSLDNLYLSQGQLAYKGRLYREIEERMVVRSLHLAHAREKELSAARSEARARGERFGFVILEMIAAGFLMAAVAFGSFFLLAGYGAAQIWKFKPTMALGYGLVQSGAVGFAYSLSQGSERIKTLAILFLPLIFVMIGLFLNWIYSLWKDSEKVFVFFRHMHVDSATGLKEFQFNEPLKDRKQWKTEAVNRFFRWTQYEEIALNKIVSVSINGQEVFHRDRAPAKFMKALIEEKIEKPSFPEPAQGVVIYRILYETKRRPESRVEDQDYHLDMLQNMKVAFLRHLGFATLYEYAASITSYEANRVIDSILSTSFSWMGNGVHFPEIWASVWSHLADSQNDHTKREMIFLAGSYLFPDSLAFQAIQHRLNVVYPETMERFYGLHPARANIPFEPFPIPGYLFLPPHASDFQKVPVTVIFTGFSKRKEYPPFDELIQQLVASGSAVLTVDYPRHGENKNSIHSFTDFSALAQAVVKFLHDRPEIEDDKIYAIGYSFGGYVAMRIAEEPLQHHFQQIHIINAPWHDTFLHQENLKVLSWYLNYAFAGSEKTVPQHLEELARGRKDLPGVSTNRWRKIHAYYAAGDPIVTEEERKQMRQRLELGRGTYQEYKGTHHLSADVRKTIYPKIVQMIRNDISARRPESRLSELTPMDEWSLRQHLIKEYRRVLARSLEPQAPFRLTKPLLAIATVLCYALAYFFWHTDWAEEFWGFAPMNAIRYLMGGGFGVLAFSMNVFLAQSFLGPQKEFKPIIIPNANAPRVWVASLTYKLNHLEKLSKRGELSHEKLVTTLLAAQNELIREARLSANEEDVESESRLAMIYGEFLQAFYFNPAIFDLAENTKEQLFTKQSLFLNQNADAIQWGMNVLKATGLSRFMPQENLRPTREEFERFMAILKKVIPGLEVQRRPESRAELAEAPVVSAEQVWSQHYHSDSKKPFDTGIWNTLGSWIKGEIVDEKKRSGAEIVPILEIGGGSMHQAKDLREFLPAEQFPITVVDKAKVPETAIQGAKGIHYVSASAHTFKLEPGMPRPKIIFGLRALEYTNIPETLDHLYNIADDEAQFFFILNHPDSPAVLKTKMELLYWKALIDVRHLGLRFLKGEIDGATLDAEAFFKIEEIGSAFENKAKMDFRFEPVWNEMLHKNRKRGKRLVYEWLDLKDAANDEKINKEIRALTMTIKRLENQLAKHQLQFKPILNLEQLFQIDHWTDDDREEFLLKWGMAPSSYMAQIKMAKIFIQHGFKIADQMTVRPHGGQTMYLVYRLLKSKAARAEARSEMEQKAQQTFERLIVPAFLEKGTPDLKAVEPLVLAYAKNQQWKLGEWEEATLIEIVLQKIDQFPGAFRTPLQREFVQALDLKSVSVVDQVLGYPTKQLAHLNPRILSADGYLVDEDKHHRQSKYSGAVTIRDPFSEKNKISFVAEYRPNAKDEAAFLFHVWNESRLGIYRLTGVTAFQPLPFLREVQFTLPRWEGWNQLTRSESRSFYQRYPRLQDFADAFHEFKHLKEDELERLGDGYFGKLMASDPEWIQRILEATPLGPDRKILDIGSGMGNAALLLSFLTGASVVSIEHDPVRYRFSLAFKEFLEREKGFSFWNLTFLQGNALDYSFSDYDLIYFFYAVPEFYEGDFGLDLFDKLRYEMKPGASFVSPAFHLSRETQGSPLLNSSRKKMAEKRGLLYEEINDVDPPTAVVRKLRVESRMDKIPEIYKINESNNGQEVQTVAAIRAKSDAVSLTVVDNKIEPGIHRGDIFYFAKPLDPAEGMKSQLVLYEEVEGDSSHKILVLRSLFPNVRPFKVSASDFFKKVLEENGVRRLTPKSENISEEEPQFEAVTEEQVQQAKPQAAPQIEIVREGNVEAALVLKRETLADGSPKVTYAFIKPWTIKKIVTLDGQLGGAFVVDTIESKKEGKLNRLDITKIIQINDHVTVTFKRSIVKRAEVRDPAAHEKAFLQDLERFQQVHQPGRVPSIADSAFKIRRVLKELVSQKIKVFIDVNSGSGAIPVLGAYYGAKPVHSFQPESEVLKSSRGVVQQVIQRRGGYQMISQIQILNQKFNLPALSRFGKRQMIFYYSDANASDFYKKLSLLPPGSIIIFDSSAEIKKEEMAFMERIETDIYRVPHVVTKTPKVVLKEKVLKKTAFNIPENLLRRVLVIDHRVERGRALVEALTPWGFSSVDAVQGLSELTKMQNQGRFVLVVNNGKGQLKSRFSGDMRQYRDKPFYMMQPNKGEITTPENLPQRLEEWVQASSQNISRAESRQELSFEWYSDLKKKLSKDLESVERFVQQNWNESDYTNWNGVGRDALILFHSTHNGRVAIGAYSYQNSWRDPSALWTNGIYIKEGLRGEGFGALLRDELYARLKAKDRPLLEIRVDETSEAQGFQRKLLEENPQAVRGIAFYSEDPEEEIFIDSVNSALHLANMLQENSAKKIGVVVVDLQAYEPRQKDLGPLVIGILEPEKMNSQAIKEIRSEIRSVGVELFLRNVERAAPDVLQRYVLELEMQQVLIENGFSKEEFNVLIENQRREFAQANSSVTRMAPVIYWTPELAQDHYLIDYLEDLREKFGSETDHWKVFLVVPQEHYSAYKSFATQLAKQGLNKNVEALIEGILSPMTIQNRLEQQVFNNPDFKDHFALFFFPQKWHSGNPQRTVFSETLLGGKVLLRPLTEYFASTIQVRGDTLKQSLPEAYARFIDTSNGTIVIAKALAQFLVNQYKLLAASA